MALRSLSICSGCGLLDLAIHEVIGDALPIAYVENEATVAAILAAHVEAGRLPPAPIWSDLRTVCDAAFGAYVRAAGGIDFLYGGFPCQPHSVAGKQRGADDERDLWPDIERIIERYKPALCFFENVPGILGYLSERIVPFLRRAGYLMPRPLLLEAAHVGASHKRERLFFLAYRSDSRCLIDMQRHGDAPRVAADGHSSGHDVDGRDSLMELAHVERNGRQWHEQPARDAAGDGQQSTSSSIQLAHSPGRRRRKLRQPSGGGGQLYGGDKQLDDTASKRAGISGAPEPRRDGADDGVLGAAGDELVNARRGSVERRGEPGDIRGAAVGVDGEGNQRERSGDADSGSGVVLDDAYRARCSQALRRSDERTPGQQGGQCVPGNGRDQLPAFPPGPGFGLDAVVDDVLAELTSDPDTGRARFLAELANYAAWQRILAERPDLAPATVEREIRVVAHERAAGLGDWPGRIDQLRCLGNGVVVDQAAEALRILLERVTKVKRSK